MHKLWFLAVSVPQFPEQITLILIQEFVPLVHTGCE